MNRHHGHYELKRRARAARLAPRSLAHSMACLLAVAIVVLGASSDTLAKSDSRPNVILILADDLGYGDLGCYGQKQVQTPHLDRLASEGMRFTQAYAGGTVCAPSRCVLMTGLHGGHARVRGNGDATKPGLALQQGDTTIARILQAAGYQTGIIGKWGLGEETRNTAGLPGNQGFDHFFGYLRHGHAHNHYTDYLWRNGEKVRLANVISDDPKHKGNVAVEKVEYTHDLFAEDALDFIRDHQQEPFFLYLAFTVPHANNEAGDEGMEVPDYGQYAARDWPVAQKGHAAMITRMDRDVGRLLALLDELQLRDNTLVIFASDNGPHREGGFDPDFYDSNGPLRGYKGNLSEGGIRVPLVACWPGRIAAGTTSDAVVHFADMMPTLGAIAGARVPTGLDGVDFSPTLFGEKQPELAARYLYWEWNRRHLRSQAARWQNWKAIRDPQSGSIEIYDLSTDIGETQDLAAKHPEIVARFRSFFKSAREPSPHWPAQASARRN